MIGSLSAVATSTATAVASITLSAARTSVIVGDTATVTVKVLDELGVDVTAKSAVTFTTGGPAHIGQTGLITTGIGSAWIRASSGGMSSGIVTFDIRAPRTISLAVSNTTLTIGSSSDRPVLTALATNERGVTDVVAAWWYSDDPTVAGLSSAGVVTPNGSGVTTIHAAYDGFDATSRITVSLVPWLSMPLRLITQFSAP